jgi:ABC-type multidrug transport system ATPase subunit
MITLQDVRARRAPLALAGLSVSWNAGVHAVVGSPGDGGPLLLALIAGRERPRAGSVQVTDGEPTRADVRPRIAYVPLHPVLPEALRVDEVLRTAAAIRGDAPADPAARLAVLGVESLARRPVRSLFVEEVHTVALAEALTSSRAQVLLFEEPLLALDPRATSRVAEAIRARAREGRAVVVATASVRDSAELADDHLLLRGGKVVGRGGSGMDGAALPADGARLRIVSSDAQELLAAIAHEEAVEAVARRDAAVIVRGRSASALAEAVGRAVTISGVEITELRFELPEKTP